MEGHRLQRRIAPRFVVGGEDGSVHTDEQVVVGLLEERVMPVQVVRHKDYTHSTETHHGAIQIGDHHKGDHLALYVPMIHLLTQTFHSLEESIDTLVLHLQSSGDADEQGVGGNYPTQLLSGYAQQRLACLGTTLVEGLTHGYEVGFKAIRGNDVHRFVQQLGTLACRDLAHRREAVGPVGSLFLYGVLADHIQFLGHLIAVVTREIVV